jgi:pimeloyl-ACP methyl ester carboxylesterase
MCDVSASGRAARAAGMRMARACGAVTRAMAAAGLLACGVTAAAAQGLASEGLVEVHHAIPLPRGTQLDVVVSRRKDAMPATAVLLFPGYPGILRIRNEGGSPAFDLGGNFLVRARRHLNAEDVFTVLVDCPVDQRTACGDAYRSSPQHAEDIGRLVRFVRSELGAGQVYLLGTSYGTVSTAFLARALGAEIDGAIHAAAFTDPRPGRNSHGTAMAGFDWAVAGVPQLFVHHKDDPCDVTRHASIDKQRGRIPLITVEGVVEPRGEPCQAYSAHGFVGREKATMQAIGAWIRTRDVQQVVSGNP